VPYAGVGPIKVENGLSGEQVLFLSDIFPTGYMAADFCNIHPQDTIAIWGCGPVGQFAIRSAFLLGAARVIVIAIDTVPERLQPARGAGAETPRKQKVGEGGGALAPRHRRFRAFTRG
jgi:threonine dehydrogenase-like Zn-dependent dehydrogenase